MKRKNFVARLLVAAALVCSATAGTAAHAAPEPLTVVYWSAKDCRWCTWWEGSILGSGGEAKFLKSAEGKAVRYIVVKKPTLAAPFTERDFAADQKWLWPRVKNETDGKIRGFPSFSLYEGEKFVAYALGQPDVKTTLLPAIRARMN